MRRTILIAFAVIASSCVADEVAAPEPECGGGLANVALDEEASASTSTPASGPDLAFDGDEQTAWIAGSNEPNTWVEVDLGETRPVSCVRLLVGSDGADTGTHRVNGGAHANPGRELGTIDATSEWIELEGDWEFRFLRVTTLSSTSPPSWSEIEVR